MAPVPRKCEIPRVTNVVTAIIGLIRDHKLRAWLVVAQRYRPSDPRLAV